MKSLRYVMMVVLVLAVGSVAHAFTFQLQDPSTNDSDLPVFAIQPGAAFSFGFANCHVWLDGTLFTGCAIGFNLSDQTITSLDFDFDNGLGGANVNCASDTFVATNCGLTSDGTEYVLNFADDCGTNSCGIAPLHYVLIFENATDGSDFPDVAGVANVPEPNSIWLALSGLGSAGYFIRRRRVRSLA